MAEDRKIEFGESRALSNTNYDYAELSSAKKTIWNDYFLSLFKDMPKTAAKANLASTNSNDAIIPPPATGADSALRSALIPRISTLGGKVTAVPTGSFARKFFAKETFKGRVVEIDGSKFSAIIEDSAGDKYRYVFEDDELPDRQRSEVRTGSPIVVHIGFEYRGSTKCNLAKIFLSNYDNDEEMKAQLVARKVARWTF